MATHDVTPRAPLASPARLRGDRRARIAVVVLLVVALAALGSAPLATCDSYSWGELGTSESAAQGVDGAWIARSRFLLFGAVVVWLAALQARCWEPLATFVHRCFGMSMLAVAVFSSKSRVDGATYVESEAVLPSMFASIIGFSFIAGIVAVATARWRSDDHPAALDWFAFTVP